MKKRTSHQEIYKIDDFNQMNRLIILQLLKKSKLIFKGIIVFFHPKTKSSMLNQLRNYKSSYNHMR